MEKITGNISSQRNRYSKIDKRQRHRWNHKNRRVNHKNLVQFGIKIVVYIKSARNEAVDAIVFYDITKGGSWA